MFSSEKLKRKLRGLLMENESRTKKIKLNSAISLATQLCQILLGFVIRRLFINYLGITYLGYNSVFAHILQMLNLADMGIGVAVTSYLYKPLAENDRSRIVAIIAIYRRLYSTIGLAVLFIGVIISLFIDKLIPDATCSIEYLRILYYINLVGIVSTYFLAYKRTLIVADQKSYVTNIIDTLVSFIVSVLQIIFLIFQPNYVIYLCLAITKNIVSNIIISIKVNQNYKYIYSEPNHEVVVEYKHKIYQYIKDVFVSRIGAIVYYSTDNIIISILKGSLLSGYLSNYTMITSHLNTIVVQILGSIQSTFGNYVSTNKNKDEQRIMTDNYLCAIFIIANICFVCFTLLVQPFVKIFFGDDMVLDFFTAFLLGINLMLTLLIQLPSQVFIIFKLFSYDRFIITISAILNIIISVVLVKKIGVNGVLIGTFITSLIYLFSRFYIISKYVYAIKYWHYIKKLGIYCVVSVLTFISTFISTINLDVNGLQLFVFRTIIVCILSVLSTIFLLSFTAEFDFLKNRLVHQTIKKYLKKAIIGLCWFIVMLLTTVWSNNYAKFSITGNKSYIRYDSYVIESNTGKNVFSLSFDDTFCVFKNIADTKPKSIFENPTFSWYRELHNRYGVVISSYVYFEDNDFNLTNFPANYKEEFIANSDWLRFGFHARNKSTYYVSEEIKADYVKTINELKRIMGKECIDNVIRLQGFQGSIDEIRKLRLLKEEPIVGLFTADDNRQSYYLDMEKNKYIYSHDECYDKNLDLFFFSTDFRIEYVDNINVKLDELNKDSWKNQKGDLVVFSHEWALNTVNRLKIEKVCKYAQDKGYKFGFFEDLIKLKL